MTSAKNPYVGPRTFSKDEAHLFFGREQEAHDLLARVISERLVLFYAQSGAGKSSLINTRLIPQLPENGFLPLPIGRVSGELPQGIEAVDNIYLFNLLLSLDQSQGDTNRFATMTLSDFMAGLTTPDGERFYYDERVAAESDVAGNPADDEPPHVLIIDQFEEIVTTHPVHWPERATFFRQLAEAMHNDPLLWVVLTLREDFVATLDPYTDLVPGKMRARFYMQRMETAAALDAVRRPAGEAGRPFAPGVAERLIDNLRQIRGHPETGRTTTQLGQFVEPVQLQVVCYQLWENLKDRPVGEITAQDLAELGDVDSALAAFYNQVVENTLANSNISERALRHWFDSQLITEAGTRGMVYQGREETAGLPNTVVKRLIDQFILRVEVRAGGTWIELIHDRLVAPIQQLNQTWQASYHNPVAAARTRWLERGRDPAHLLRGEALAEAEAFAAVYPQEIEPDEQEFLSQSRRQVNLEAARRRNVVIAVGIIMLLFAGLAVWGWLNAAEAQRQQAVAVAALVTVGAAQTAVTAADQVALEAKLTAEAAVAAVITPPFGETPSIGGQQTAVAALETATAAIMQADAARLKADQALALSLAAISPTELPTPLPTITPDQITPTPSTDLPSAINATQTAIARTIGAELTQITKDGNFNEQTVSFSPDQRTLVISSDHNGGSQIFALTPDGRHLNASDWQQLTSNASENFHPRFAPDGKTIAFTSNLNGDWDIYTIKLDDLDPHNLTNSPGVDRYPSFSQDGQMIVFESERSGTSGIYVMNADGTSQRPVIDTAASEVYPYISPDGQSVVYFSDSEGNWEIYIIPTNGSTPTRLTNHPARDADPVFAPDGRTIVFETNRDGDQEIYAMDVDGADLRNLTQFPEGNDQVPSVSPDGRWVVFQSDRNGLWDIYQIPLTQVALQTAEIESTSTATRQIVTVPTPTSSLTVCSFEPEPEIVAIWKEHRAELGCPVSDDSIEITVQQKFEQGSMYWSSLPDQILVMIGDDNGQWNRFPYQEQTWRIEQGGPSCEAEVPTGLLQPISGFGGLWCAKPDIRDGIGFATEPEHAVEFYLLQEFMEGAILIDMKDNFVYILGEDNRYEKDEF